MQNRYSFEWNRAHHTIPTHDGWFEWNAKPFANRNYEKGTAINMRCVRKTLFAQKVFPLISIHLCWTNHWLCASHLRALWIPSNQNHDVLINVVVFFIITDYIFRRKIVTSIRHTHWLSHNGIWMIISKSNYACIESEVSSSVLLLPTAPNIQMIKHTSIWMTVWQNVFILWIKDFYAHKEHDTLAQWGWNDNKSRTAVHRSFVK